MKKNQEGIQAAIPEISNSVISALKAHDLTFPTTQCVNDTAEHADPDTSAAFTDTSSERNYNLSCVKQAYWSERQQ